MRQGMSENLDIVWFVSSTGVKQKRRRQHQKVWNKQKKNVHAIKHTFFMHNSCDFDLISRSCGIPFCSIFFFTNFYAYRKIQTRKFQIKYLKNKFLSFLFALFLFYFFRFHKKLVVIYSWTSDFISFIMPYNYSKNRSVRTLWRFHGIHSIDRVVKWN